MNELVVPDALARLDVDADESTARTGCRPGRCPPYMSLVAEEVGM